MIRAGFSWYVVWLYRYRKRDASRALWQLRCDARSDGAVPIIRNDGDGPESQGQFRDVWYKHHV